MFKRLFIFTRFHCSTLEIKHFVLIGLQIDCKILTMKPEVCNGREINIVVELTDCHEFCWVLSFTFR